MNDYQGALETQVLAKVNMLEEVGWAKYQVKA
jgi:hypothetical protein